METYLSDRPDIIFVDTETHGVRFYDNPFCMTVAWRDRDGGVQSHYLEFENGVELGMRYAAEMLTVTPKLGFHNAKFDLQKLILKGIISRDEITPNRIEDTEACAHLLDEHREKKLKYLARELLGLNTDETDALKKARKKAGLKVSDGYALLPREVVVPYAIRDAEFTLLLWELLRPQLKDELEQLYEWEMELCLALLDMEAAGYRLDVEYTEKTAKHFAGQILINELSIEKLTGLKVWYPKKSGQKTPEGCINPNAWQQTLPVIQERGIKVKSTGNDILKPYEDDPFVKALLELRFNKKIYNTYLMNMLKEQKDGIIHVSIRQHGAKTGRTSSGEAQDG